MKFAYQARYANREASRTESILNTITQATIPFTTPEELGPQRKTRERLRKRAVILCELEQICSKKARQLGSGSTLEDIQLVEDDSRVTRLMGHLYCSDPTIRASVNACFGQMEYGDKIFRLKRVIMLVHEKRQKAEEMRLRQLETGLNGMALSGGDGLQDKAGTMADLLAKMSL